MVGLRITVQWMVDVCNRSVGTCEWAVEAMPASLPTVMIE
jgi:hypothetical protein